MRYRPSDVPHLARTPVGRRQLRNSAYQLAWPLVRSAATAHRATLARRARVVAIVGSLGKTTTARAVLAALTGGGGEIAENHLSFVAGAVLRIRPHTRHAVIEVGIEQPGQMDPYARLLRPDVVVVTSIASEHGRSFGTLEATRAEKTKMVRALPPSGVAVLNADDANVCWMAGETRATVRTYGFSPGAHVRADDIEIDWPHGTRFTLRMNGRAHRARIRLLGPELTRAALAAVAVAETEGVGAESALEALADLPPTPLRLEPVPASSGAFLLRDEFKSTLETVHAALDLLAAIPARRRIVVLGDVAEPPGSQGPIYRDVGARLARTADRVVVVGRGFQRFAAGAARAGMPRDALADAGSSVRRATELLENLAVGPGDVVLLKGRDTQRLDRVALALLGRPVRCEIGFCRSISRCDSCPMLARGWDGLRVVI